MKQLIIIGAGGFGREVYNFALKSKGYNLDFAIKGFLDVNPDALAGFKGYPLVLGNENDYAIQMDDVFVNAIGDNEMRKKTSETILSRGGQFITLIHNTAIINTNVVLGKGCIIEPYAYVGSDSSIGDFTIVQNNAVVAHDVSVGSFTRIDCHVTLVGGISVGSSVYIHTGAVINHKVVVEDNATVGANSFVIMKVKSGETVYGNPARRLVSNN